MKKYIALVLLLLANFSFGQTAVSILKKMQEQSKIQDTYQVNLDYNLYRGYKSQDVLESYKGVFFKKGKKQYSKIGIVELLNTPTINLKINKEQKAILVSDPIAVVGSETAFDYEKIKDYVDLELLKDNNSYWTIKLKSKSITQLPFKTLEVQIDKKTHLLKKQVFYYIGQLDFSEDNEMVDMDTPRLEVIYSSYKYTNFKFTEAVFDSSKYIKKSGSKFVASAKYAGYRVIDTSSLNNKK